VAAEIVQDDDIARREGRGQQHVRPKEIRRLDPGKPRNLPESELERYCEIIAALKLQRSLDRLVKFVAEDPRPSYGIVSECF